MTSLSARSPTPARPDREVTNLYHDALKHAPETARITKEADKQLCNVKQVDIKVSSEETVQSVSGFLHTPRNYRRGATEGREKTAAILLSGASGGVVGPSSIYLSMADKLASLNEGIPVLRLDYRYPARNKYCVPDVLAAMNYLQNGFAISRFVLVGWSYGGAPAFTVGGQDDRVCGCATVATQTAETQGVEQVATKGLPVLMLHGKADQRLSSWCSESLQTKYNRHAKGGECELKLYDGGDHSFTKHSLEAEVKLSEFIMKLAGIEVDEKEHQAVLEKPLVGEEEKVEKMKEGSDLKDESIE